MRSGTVKRYLSVVSVLFFLLPACGEKGGCGGLFSGSKDGVSVTVEKVRVREVSPILTITGNLIPNDKAAVTFPYDVKIQEVFVKEGSYVGEGDPLFRISDEEINNDLNVARTRRNELIGLIDKNTNLLRSKERSLEEGKVDQEEVTRLEKEIALNEAELERVKAELVKFSYELDHATVSSPISGMVVGRNISSGSVVKADQTLLTIVNINPIIVSFPLNSKQSNDISIGSPIKVFVNELGATYDAKVTYVSPELHGIGKTFEVWASMPNPEVELKAGMTASTDFVSEKLSHVFVIPLSSVLSKASNPYVYMVTGQVANKTPIVIGSIDGEVVEVVDGLEEGDIVVVKGGEQLFDGADVTIWR